MSRTNVIGIQMSSRLEGLMNHFKSRKSLTVHVADDGFEGFTVKSDGSIIYQAHSLRRCWRFMADEVKRGDFLYYVEGMEGKKWVKMMVDSERLKEE